MLKKLVFIAVCLSSFSFSINCTSGLKKAVDNLDVEEVVRIIDSNPQELTDNELIWHITELKAKIEKSSFVDFTKLLIGTIAGWTAGIFVGRHFFGNQEPPFSDGTLSKPRVAKFLTAAAGLFIGCTAATAFLNASQRSKAQVILYLLLNKLSNDQQARIKSAGLIPSYTFW